MVMKVDRLLGLEALEANTRKLAESRRDDVVITQVGESRCGRPIEMISIGEGSRNVLIVGVPHPNEPAGAVTVERLIDLMTGTDARRQRRGYRWHFIKAIDPEGLRMNDGWIAAPLTPESYCTHYFRPALARQPESTFAVKVGAFEFNDSTVENQAYQRAFELTRPVLHAALHHADYGGVVHLLSRVEPDLVAPLERVTSRHGQVPMDLEAPLFPIQYIGTGVAVHPSVPAVIGPRLEAGADPATVWPAGELSPGYGEAKFGTCTIITEVPLWDDPRLRDRTISSFKRRHCVDFDIVKFEALRAYLDSHVEALVRPVDSSDGPELAAAVEEFDLQCRLFLGQADQQSQRPDADEQITVAEYWWRRNFMLFVHLRIFGLLRRVADAQPASEAAERARREATAIFQRLLDELQPERLEPLALATMTGIQMDAILASAEYFNAQGEPAHVRQPD